MTEHSRSWRDKKINRIRIVNKIHNIILGAITGMMGVFFCLSLCAEINKYTIMASIISATWLTLIERVNEF